MNQLYQGDNLQILRDMPSESVDLIATDPPFNTGKDWGAFNDKWEGGLKGYLKFMEPRLVECRRVLRDTGSLYLHCDTKTNCYLRIMLDSVFGINQFRNEIIWHYYNTPTNSKNRFGSKHDTIFFYAKSKHNTFDDIESREPYSKDSHWINNPEGYGAGYKGNPNGKRMHDVWRLTTINNMAKERLGYPTQKPVSLYERMISASSNQGDTVLDPFCGSGTTLDAAQSLGRHWIGIDQSSEAINVIQGRLRDRHGLEYDRDYQLTTESERSERTEN